jgi:hypothetical protein
MLSFCEDVGVANCSSHILSSYNRTLGFISSVYPDSVTGQDIPLIVSSSSFRPISSSVVTSLHSGTTLDNRSLHPHRCACSWSLLHNWHHDHLSIATWILLDADEAL